MQCAACGATVAAGAMHCGACGALAARTTRPPRLSRPASGIPTEPYVISSYGAPVAADAHVPVAEPPPGTVAIRRPGYRPIVPPPPPKPHQRGCLWALVRTVVVLALVAGAALGLRAYGPRLLSAGLVRIGSPTHTQRTPVPTAVPACAPAPVDHAAAAALGHAQMATAVRNAAGQDYRPANNVVTFAPGQEAHLTFEIATAQAGTAAVTFCTPTGQLTGSLSVPAHSAGRYAEFSARVTAAQAGTGVATLTWNGAVAANVAFTVSK